VIASLTISIEPVAISVRLYAPIMASVRVAFDLLRNHIGPSMTADAALVGVCRHATGPFGVSRVSTYAGSFIPVTSFDQPQGRTLDMRIAQIAPLIEAVPPKLYGGTERVVAYLTDALVELGHDVTLFASGDSETKAKLAAIWPRALRLDPTVKDYFAPIFMELEIVARRAHEFDIIHAHLDYFGYPLLRRLGVPSVTTLHGRLDLPELPALYGLYGDVPVVSISDSQRAPLPQANYIATVLHGLPQHLLAQGPGDGGYVAFLGRISPEKAPDAAIRIAIAAGVPIKLAAKVDRVDEEYYKSVVEPLLSQGDIEFVGEIAEHQKSEFLGRASALLFPIAWREPFGLVMIEAMACGTPVIAFNHGSVPEVLEHGVTGFIVQNEQQAVAALAEARTLDRRRIRAEFDRRFTAHHMAQNYLKLYAHLARTQRTGTGP